MNARVTNLHLVGSGGVRYVICARVEGLVALEKERRKGCEYVFHLSHIVHSCHSSYFVMLLILAGNCNLVNRSSYLCFVWQFKMVDGSLYCNVIFQIC